MQLVNKIKAVKNSIYRKLNADRVCLPDHCGRQFEVQMWTISDFVLKKLIPVVGVHPFPLNELVLMASAVCWIKPTHIYEWGTNVGVSARIFYETVQYFKIDSEIHTIDLPDDVKHIEHPGKTRGALIKGIRKVRMHQGDGATTALALCAAEAKQGKALFFLDGDHSYESVSRELKQIDSHVGNASFLIHDTLFQSAEARYNVGPFLAVQDFLRDEPARYIRIDEHLGLPGMTLLYPQEGHHRPLADSSGT